MSDVMNICERMRCTNAVSAVLYTIHLLVFPTLCSSVSKIGKLICSHSSRSEIVTSLHSKVDR